MVAVLAVGACACKNGRKTGPTVDNPSDAGINKDPAACLAQTDAVKALYDKQMAGELAADADDEARALAAQTVADNTEMVMVDCRTNPDRFAPCLAAAVSVEQLERDCLIALDEAGRVEGRAFGGQ
jgi:hypothetical protein